MPSSDPARPGAEAGDYFDGVAEAARAELLRLRDLVYRAAVAAGVGPLAESLKWGEPSYTPARPGIGSSVRLAALHDGRVAVHFICHTGLVDRFREIYPRGIEFHGNRSIVLEPGRGLDEAALSHCVAMALTYHRDRPGRGARAPA